MRPELLGVHSLKFGRKQLVTSLFSSLEKVIISPHRIRIGSVHSSPAFILCRFHLGPCVHVVIHQADGLCSGVLSELQCGAVCVMLSLRYCMMGVGARFVCSSISRIQPDPHFNLLWVHSLKLQAVQGHKCVQVVIHQADGLCCSSGVLRELQCGAVCVMLSLLECVMGFSGRIVCSSISHIQPDPHFNSVGTQPEIAGSQCRGTNVCTLS